MSNQPPDYSKSHIQGLIGAGSTLITTCFVQPLEVIKMVMIVKANTNTNLRLASTYGAIEYIYLNERLPGFYRGLKPALVRNMSAGFLYFQALSYLSKAIDNQNAWGNFLSSFTARGAEVPGYNYTSVLKTLKSIKQQEGWLGYFKGALTCTIKDASFAGIYYVVYRKTHQFFKQESSQFDAKLTFLCGIIAGLIGTGISHPFEILRARLQTNYYDDEKSIKQRFQKIRETEGFHGFLKGLGPRLVRKPLANSFTFMLVEHFNNLIYGSQFHH